jgi:hypothetical protein
VIPPTNLFAKVRSRDMKRLKEKIVMLHFVSDASLITGPQFDKLEAFVYCCLVVLVTERFEACLYTERNTPTTSKKRYIHRLTRHSW